MASSSDRTAPESPQDDDLRLVARSAHRCQLLLLGEHRKAEYLTIEINRSVEIGHVHHDTQKVHHVLQIFSGGGGTFEAPVLPEIRLLSRVPRSAASSRTSSMSAEGRPLITGWRRVRPRSQLRIEAAWRGQRFDRPTAKALRCHPWSPPSVVP